MKVKITHPEKLLFPSITKGEFIDYYEQIAHHLISYAKDRPLTMHRFPEGIFGESFYQKDTPAYFPGWIKTVTVAKKEGGYTNYLLCQNKSTLIYIANQGCITPHIWLSKVDKMEVPDRMIFDLDPSTKDFSKVRAVALALKELLDYMELKSFVMTTGSKGLHVVVPIKREWAFKEVKDVADLCARAFIQQYPQLGTMELRKAKRGDKVFIDTLRNQYTATAVVPYAVRALPTAPVATPLYWDEVTDPSLSPQKYTINNLFERLRKIEDPWKECLKIKQSLKAVMKKLGPY